MRRERQKRKEGRRIGERDGLEYVMRSCREENEWKRAEIALRDLRIHFDI